MRLNADRVFKISEIEEILNSKQRLALSRVTERKINRAAKVVQKFAHSSEAIYGINTGFGPLARVRISAHELKDLQINLLRSHAAGIGEPLSEAVVRRILLLRVISIGKGHNGLSLSFVHRHLDYLNAGLIPWIPEQGSVGASGDLAPLAHLGLSFLAEGYFIRDGQRVPASKIYKSRRWRALNLGPKEGLSLTNGTQVSLALALQVVAEFVNLWPWIETALVLSVEGHLATERVFDPKLHQLKAHVESLEIATRLFRRLQSSPHMNSHLDCDRVQDSYSFRCAPQVLGPALSLFRKAQSMLEDEIQSVSDNPVVMFQPDEIRSCGHFHAQAVSMASDLMSMAATTIGNITERRIDQMINPLTTRGPAFLSSKAGAESGLMIVQYTAAALASENKTQSFPASSDTISTSGNQEDHVSMAPWAARKALRQLVNLRRIIAIEILCGVRACVLESTRTGLNFSPFVERNLNRFAKDLPFLFYGGDRIFSEDLQKIEAYLLSQKPID